MSPAESELKEALNVEPDNRFGSSIACISISQQTGRDQAEPCLRRVSISQRIPQAALALAD
jgi:hypothetical protein